MRRVPRAGVDRRDRLVEVGAGVTERHAMSGAAPAADQLEHRRQFRRQRHDADVGAIAPR